MTAQPESLSDIAIVETDLRLELDLTPPIVTAYDIESRQKKELVKIFGDREWPTIDYTNADERAELFGKLATAYVEDVPRPVTVRPTQRKQGLRTTAALWDQYLRGESYIDIGVMHNVRPATLHTRIGRVSYTLAQLNLSLPELVQEIGGEPVRTVSFQDYYYNGPARRALIA